MIDYLQYLDIELFKFLNGFYSEYFDCLAWLISGKLTWLPLYIILLVVVLSRGWRQALIVIIAVVVTVTLCDQITSSLIKPAVERLRPSHSEELSSIVHIVRGHVGGRYGFLSSHAANTFGVATLLACIFRRKSFTITILAWALVVSYSRIYLGVHYPGDVLCGAIMGALLGGCVYLLTQRIVKVSVCKTIKIMPYESGKIRFASIGVALNVLILVVWATAQYLMQ